MKIPSASSKHVPCSGSAVLILLVLLSLMAILTTSSHTTLRQLRKELDLIEAQQLKKFPAPPSQVQTNNPPVTNSVEEPKQ